MRWPLDDYVRAVPEDGRVLDVGCLGFVQAARAEALGRRDIRHSGVDFVAPPEGLPDGFEFATADLNSHAIPFGDDSFDLVVASHVVEHVKDPVGLILDCIRVCRPGGTIYVEAPSERSLMLPGMPFGWNRFYSLSYFDDPTHISRPWTPQAFVRLASLTGCEPQEARYLVSWPLRLLSPVLIPIALLTRSPRRLEYWTWLAVGWSCCIAMRKPETLQGATSLRYYLPEAR